MPKLAVKNLPSSDNGRLIVRLNEKYKSGIRRYNIAKITNNENGKAEYALILGHEAENVIFMPYDIRVALCVPKGGSINFSIEKVGLWGKLSWYIGSPDPAVHVPAWIAVGSLALATASLFLGVLSVTCC